MAISALQAMIMDASEKVPQLMVLAAAQNQGGPSLLAAAARAAANALALRVPAMCMLAH